MAKQDRDLLTREELRLWREDRVTKVVVGRLQKELNELTSSLVNGDTLGRSAEETCQLTAFLVGKIDGLVCFLGMEADDEPSVETRDSSHAN